MHVNISTESDVFNEDEVTILQLSIRKICEPDKRLTNMRHTHIHPDNLY